LYKKCFYVSPGQNDESPRRIILKKKLGALKHPPPRPPMDCQASILTLFWFHYILKMLVFKICDVKVDPWTSIHSRMIFKILS
jgi:serine carboxypeptidase-like clade 1